MTMALDADRWMCEAKMVVRWRQGARSTDAGLGTPRFRFEYIAFYLQLFYSREIGYMRRITTDVPATAIRGTTTIYEETQQTEGSKLATVSATRMTMMARVQTAATTRAKYVLGAEESRIYKEDDTQSLISEGKEDGASSRAECEDQVMKLRKENYEVQVPCLAIIQTLSTASYRYLSTKEKAVDRDGWLEAVHRLLPPRLHPSNCEVEGRHSRSKEVSGCTHWGRKPIFEAGSRVYRAKVTGFIRARTYATLKYLVSSSEKVVNEDGRLEVAQRHLEQGLQPPDEVPDEA
ncbi:hypothetical protein M404DRAFT_31392 [Pisolithus tinctorius Marx 270]|uniref:Uncharacterized protein n=1 Tax=Pisolithus tinctorius Marx 270 TaxID=870435 RepID=A0A0C3NB97_PISTI|nr:hypothetical protein M404DRAFT_31392 [Pisolithus tinctorius Marx 270]